MEINRGIGRGRGRGRGKRPSISRPADSNLSHRPGDSDGSSSHGIGIGRGRGRGTRPMKMKNNAKPDVSVTGPTARHGVNAQPPPKIPHKHTVPTSNDSAEDEEDININKNLSDSIWGAYISSIDEIEDEKLMVLKEKIEESTKSVSSCLVCLETMGHSDAIWQCGECYVALHLQCIHTWASQSQLAFQASHRLDDHVHDHDENHTHDHTASDDWNWACPKCRHSYTPAEVPRHYTCFCGKMRNPVFDPWVLPHSCGSLCEKPLSLTSECTHACKLICHPGACPPCPVSVDSECFCRQTRKRTRCADSNFACGKICMSRLSCGHVCENSCEQHNNHSSLSSQSGQRHPPCQKQVKRRCRCGTIEKSVMCSEGDGTLRCDRVCGKELGCGVHKCEIQCCDGSCTMKPCPHVLNTRTCPCEKTRYNPDTDNLGLKCGDQPPTCANTCGKMHVCGHECDAKCHYGPCPPCRTLTSKRCRCGLYEKTMPCCDEFRCERKCNRSKACGRHRCRLRCCDGSGECRVCTELCGKTLQCKNHKCQAPCHKGPCYPCGKREVVSCSCGKTCKIVLCGLEKTTPIPKCKKQCHRPSRCHHAPQAHVCHPVPPQCPVCTEVCKLPLPGCSHECQSSCHVVTEKMMKRELEREEEKTRLRQSVAVSLKSRKKLIELGEKEEESRLKLLQNPPPCPPCVIPMTRKCYGEHEEKEIECSGPDSYVCERECGNVLECSHHMCSKPCHRVTFRRQLDDDGHVILIDDLDLVGEVDIGVLENEEKKVREEKEKEREKEEKEQKRRQEEEEEHARARNQAPIAPTVEGVSWSEVLSHSDRPDVKQVLQISRDILHTQTQTQMQNSDFGVGFGGEKSINHNLDNDTAIVDARLQTAARAALHAREDLEVIVDTCEVCTRVCGMPRPPHCQHECTLKCHPGECPSCPHIVKRQCHCGSVKLNTACPEWCSVDRDSPAAMEALDSCGQRCPYNLDCGHQCRTVCHTRSKTKNGVEDCIRLSAAHGKCTELLNIRCECGRRSGRVECWVRRGVEGAYRMQCDSVCVQRIEEKRRNEEEEERKKKEEDEKRLQEIEDRKTRKWERRRRKERGEEEEESNSCFSKLWGLVKGPWPPLVRMIVVLLLFAVGILFNVLSVGDGGGGDVRSGFGGSEFEYDL